MRILLTFMAMLLMVSTTAFAQGRIGIKTNLLYGAGTLTPNLGMEMGLGERTTLDIALGYNWFNLDGTVENNKKLVHWMVQPEFRYFLCERFNGHFFGIHGLYSLYNIAEHELPMLFGKGSKDFRHEGRAAGAGISYGYQAMLGKRWNLELNVGVGYMQLKYDKYDCFKCGDKVEEGAAKNYFGPTKAAISLIYILN